MDKTVEEYTNLFIQIYTKKLAALGVTDPAAIQTIITCLALAAYEFGEMVKPNIPLFKSRGKYGGKK